MIKHFFFNLSLGCLVKYLNWHAIEVTDKNNLSLKIFSLQNKQRVLERHNSACLDLFYR